jgi:3-phosphoshikimate 1-carboxyvinyltransferase
MENVQLPLSKSILNRLLLLSAISGTAVNYLPAESTLPNDVVVMKRLLFENDTNDFNVEDAGTVFRFLTSYLCIKEGIHLIYGTPKLNSRPIKPLVDALIALGADIVYAGAPGEAPLKITGKKLEGGEITINASLSSQFVSSLMLIASTFPKGLKIHLQNTTSLPYIHMTKKCLEYFGVESSFENEIINIKYTPSLKPIKGIMDIESDWSSAAFWYALCAVTHKSFCFTNLSLQSIQGDKVCVELFKKIGVVTSSFDDETRIEYKNKIENNLEFHLEDCPDIAPALIVACALQNKRAVFYGLHTLQRKESNRVEALQTELKKLNIEFTGSGDHWILIPDNLLPIKEASAFSFVLNTYNDHRLAMAFACVKALNNKIEIENMECVKKSYPMFWEEYFRVMGNG